MTAHRVQGSHLGLIPDPAADTTQIWLFILRPPVGDEDDGTSTDRAVHLFLPDDALSLIGFDDTYPAVDMQQYKTKVHDANPPFHHFNASQLACMLHVLLFV